MEYRAVGQSGLIVSTIGLGCNNLGRSQTSTEEFEPAQAVVHAAIDAGITLFDTADSYGKRPGLSEEFLGRALGSRRDQVVVATKFGMSVQGVNGVDFGARGSRHYIIQSVEASLRRLGTEWIDLYQFHTPDPVTPIEETLSALDTLVSSGKVRYIGHSNRAGWQIAQAAHVAADLSVAPFISSQSHYNLLDRRAELEVIPASAHYGLGLLPYFPLANGLLTGKYTDQVLPEGSRLAHPRKAELFNSANFEQLRAFRDFAQVRDLTEIDVAFAWLLSHSVVPSVIAGATSPAQVAQNAASAKVSLGADAVAELEGIFPAPAQIALF